MKSTKKWLGKEEAHQSVLYLALEGLEVARFATPDANDTRVGAGHHHGAVTRHIDTCRHIELQCRQL